MADLAQKLQHAVWTTESMTSQASRIVLQAQSLPAEQKTKLPQFPGLWRQSDIEEYLRRVEYALREPRIYRSQQLLQEKGISVEELPTDVLEATEDVSRLLTLTESGGEIDGLLDVLFQGGIVSEWLAQGKRGLETALQKIENAQNFRPVLSQIMELMLPLEVKKPLIVDAFDDPTRSRALATSLAIWLNSISDCGIDASFVGSEFDKFTQLCDSVHDLINSLEGVYSRSREDVKAIVSGATLEEANAKLTTELEQLKGEFGHLERDWHELTVTLQMLGDSVNEKPKTLDDLRSALKQLKERREELLSGPERRLLDFILGSGEFPEDIGVGAIKNALLKLRPLIKTGLGGDIWPM